MTQKLNASERMPLSAAVAATLAATGLAVAQAVVAGAADWEFPSWGETTLQVARDLGLAAIFVVGFRILVGRSPAINDMGLVDRPGLEQPAGLWREAVGAAICTLVVFLFLALVGLDISLGLLAVTVFVRWPISVLAQQALFFGWLQPRLGRNGPTISALLYAGYHINNPLMVVVVLPLGFAFAHLRQRTGGIRVGVALHYAIEIPFLLLTFR